MLLLGNIGEVIGLNEKDIVQKECEKNGLKIAKEMRKGYEKYDFIPAELMELSKTAEIMLYDIQK